MISATSIIISLAMLIQLALSAAALWHIFTHKTYDVGNRAIWVIVSFVNFIGPIAYFCFGREKSAKAGAFWERRAVQTVANIIYAIGVASVITLGCFALFGSKDPLNPNAMIAWSWRELGFIYLAMGTILMLPSCFSVIEANAIRRTAHRKRNTLLVLLPGIVCGGCALYIVGILVAAYFMMFMKMIGV